MASYTVKQGDTLSAIAKQYGTTYQEIAKANGISDPNKIQVGQTLNIGDTATDSSATQQPSSDVTPETKAPSFDYGTYQPSDTVAQAEALLQQQLSQKPGEYTSAWQTQLNDTLNKILNREKFSYDLNGDALYQQYKDQYTTQGKKAMMDTVGQLQSMTGGYGNSYAQSVGQQAYQGYLQQLNDKIPELYQLALNQYNTEGQALYDQASLLAGMEEQEYSRYMDQLTNYYTELGMAQDEARYQAEQDYGRYMDQLSFAHGQFSDNRSYNYQTGRDAVADQQWQAQFDEAQRQYDEQMALSKGKSSSSGGSGSGGGGGYDSETAYDAYNAGKGNTVDNTTASVSDSIKKKASGFTNNTEEQADALYAEYKQVDRAALKDRSWTLQDDGGVNWFWGVDNNATVKDQYGNTYRLDKLVDALVADGMSKADAKNYVKNLQAKLGA